MWAGRHARYRAQILKDSVAGARLQRSCTREGGGRQSERVFSRVRLTSALIRPGPRLTRRARGVGRAAGAVGRTVLVVTGAQRQFVPHCTRRCVALQRRALVGVQPSSWSPPAGVLFCRFVPGLFVGERESDVARGGRDRSGELRTL